MNELADLIREQAMAMNMSAMSAYDAGLNEGFRRGIARAVTTTEYYANRCALEHALAQLLVEIRSLKLNP